MQTFDEAPFAAGDVVIVPVLFSDRLAEKRRPALVVSNNKLAAEGMVWVVMITSSRRSASQADCAIADRHAAGLDVDCVVRATKIAGVEPARITRKAGRIGEHELQHVLFNVRRFIGSPGESP